MNDRFHYDALVDDALRSVVRRVLTQVAEKGLPGSHDTEPEERPFTPLT